MLKIEFFELSVDSAYTIASFVSKATQLSSVSVSIDGWDEGSPSFNNTPPPMVFINHPNLRKFRWTCDCAHFHLQLGNLPFDEILYVDQWTFILRKKLARNNYCAIEIPEHSNITFSPNFSLALESVFYKCSGSKNERCFIHFAESRLNENGTDPLTQNLTRILANSPHLNNFTFIIDHHLFHFTRADVQELVEKIASQTD